MAVLYLHGLHGSLSNEKKESLEFYFKDVVAPSINYLSDNIDELVSKCMRENEIELVIGTSLGGYIAYHLARQCNMNALLFNPALEKRSVNPKFVTMPKYDYYNSTMHVVIGGMDKVVSPQSTLSFFTNNIGMSNVTLCYHPSLEHRIDETTFSNEVSNLSALI